LGEGGNSLLAGAEPGEHYFVVCILGDRGELANVIPHKYFLSRDARLVHGFDGLEDDERHEFFRIQVLTSPTFEDSERYNELGARGFTVNLPPAHTVPPLVRALPGVAARNQARPVGNFFPRSEFPGHPPGPIRSRTAVLVAGDVKF